MSAASAPDAPPLLDTYNLLADDVRAAPGGRRGARSTAAALRHTAVAVAATLGVPPGEAVHDPASERLQAGPFKYAQVIGILPSAFASDTDPSRVGPFGWLRVRVQFRCALP